MTLPDHDFDPDDNYLDDTGRTGIDEDASTEALVWQLLLIINPGDEDAALQQFTAFQDALGGVDADDTDLPALLREVTDWKSGFHIAEADTGGLIECLVELASRFNLDLDWDVEDPTDDGFLARVSAGELLQAACDQLRLEGYTLWTWETGTDTHAGWISSSSDDEGVRIIAAALGFDVRPAGV